MKLSITNRVTADGEPTGNVDYWMWCPGCDETHRIDNKWDFDGNTESPTFNPSILVTNGHYAAEFVAGSDCWCTYNQSHPDKPSHYKCGRCHSFVRNGQWEFLGDSEHALAGQTVPMVDLPDWLANKA